MKTFKQLWQSQSEWSQRTFGSDAVKGPEGPLNHLSKEVQEVLANPKDIEEYADCLLLIFDACRRAGFQYDELRKTVITKHEINKGRIWGKQNSQGFSEHVNE